MRIQLKGGKPVVVEHRHQRQPGRSVYVCPKLGCFDKALRRGYITFKRSKYDKIIVYLEANERDALLMRLKRHCRVRDSLN